MASTASTGQPRGEGRGRSRARTAKAGPARPPAQPVEQRPRRYMVAVLPPQQLAAAGIAAQPLDMATLEKLLEGEPGVCVHRRVPASPRDSTTAARRMPFPDIIVAEMTYEQAGALRRQLPQLHLERDRLLTYSGADRPADRLSDPALVMPAGEEIDFTFLVQDTDGRPVPNAAVFVTGSGWPAHAVTGAEGRATVTLVGETPETIRSVVVRPQDGQWTARLERPALSVAHDNLVTLHSLSETFPGFPDQQTFGWGQQAMHLHRLPPTFRGGGVKVAIIDSGAAADHPDLRGELNDGVDLVDRRERGWTVDTVHRGSYSAGVITAADNGCGVVGIAVESLVHACKIFPNGRYSDLIEALDHCIEAEIDVVALGLGGSRPSPLVAAKIDQARHAGVACVVGAGDDGGPVAFPGNLPTVLTVAALGRTGTFPPDTSHAAEVFGPQTGEGYFSPRFTCHGSEVDVCAPGVAVLTVAPPDDYTVRDGTSLAAAHVTGLAALALAHHGDFRNGLGRQRGAARVDHLFQLIKSTCTPLDLGDPHRTGAGLPDALRLLGPALAGIPELPSEVLNLLDRLTAEMIQAGLLPSAPTPAPEAATAPVLAAMPPIAPGPGPAAPGQTAPGQTALAWLAEEMRIAGLLVEGPPDPLE